MTIRLLSAVLAFSAIVVACGGSMETTNMLRGKGDAPFQSINLGGRPLEMVPGRGSVWVLTCERRCTAQHPPSVGSIVRIDPERGRVIASRRILGASGIAAGKGGVFVIDAFRDTVRRLDPASLRVTASLRLALPFELVPGDNAFFPYDIAIASKAVWVSTARGVLARIANGASRVAAMVRMPFDAGGEVAADEEAVWVAESLLGVYRIDPATNRVVAKIRAGEPERRLAISYVVLGAGKVFAVGARTKDSVVAGGNALVRLDTQTNRAAEVTPLPRGGLNVAFGNGALWVARLGRSSILRIDPGTGEVTDRLSAKVGVALVIAGGRLWTASRNGTIRQIAAP